MYEFVTHNSVHNRFLTPFQDCLTSFFKTFFSVEDSSAPPYVSLLFPVHKGESNFCLCSRQQERSMSYCYTQELKIPSFFITFLLRFQFTPNYKHQYALEIELLFKKKKNPETDLGI
jgi:hypothetical protein